MKLADKISWLRENIGESVRIKKPKRCFFRRGIYWVSDGRWLSITDRKDHWFVIRTTSKNHNNRGVERSIAIDVDKITGHRCNTKGTFLNGAWEQAVTMWPAGDEEAAIGIFNELSTQINNTYDYYYLNNFFGKT